MATDDAILRTHVGDHVEARGTLNGTTLTATEVKVEPQGEDDDDLPASPLRAAAPA